MITYPHRNDLLKKGDSKFYKKNNCFIFITLSGWYILYCNYNMHSERI